MHTGEWFATTHWSVVLAAGGSVPSEAERALEKLCRTYWPPLYGFIRRYGYAPHDAQDLTQDFMVWLLEGGHLRLADAGRGRFRTFLLVRLKHFLSDDRKKRQAQKRGGGKLIVSLDELLAEENRLEEPSSDSTPDRLFDRHWALTVLARATDRLRAEYEAGGRRELFEELKQFQLGEEASASYLEVAERLGLTESAVKSAILRLRRRHAALLRDEVAQTVATAADVDQEIRHLIEALRA